jgi:hypothetical protein
MTTPQDLASLRSLVVWDLVALRLASAGFNNRKPKLTPFAAFIGFIKHAQRMVFGVKST